jgi:hypothetical protein
MARLSRSVAAVIVAVSALVVACGAPESSEGTQSSAEAVTICPAIACPIGQHFSAEACRCFPICDPLPGCTSWSSTDCTCRECSPSIKCVAGRALNPLTCECVAAE